MLVTEPARRWRPVPPTVESHPKRRRGWLRVAGLLALLGVLVIGHGCHGEHEDDELSLTRTQRAGQGSP
jgi:hypothetical protein